MSDYGRLREQAAEAAWSRIRHLLYPETVHLLTVKDLAEALTMAGDILAPAETDAAARLPIALRQIDRLERLREYAVDTRNEAVRYADGLAYAAGYLVGRDLRGVEPGPELWRQGLAIIDEIARANNRPLPSSMRSSAA